MRADLHNNYFLSFGYSHLPKKKRKGSLRIDLQLVNTFRRRSKTDIEATTKAMVLFSSFYALHRSIISMIVSDFVSARSWWRIDDFDDDDDADHGVVPPRFVTQSKLGLVAIQALRCNDRWSPEKILSRGHFSVLWWKNYFKPKSFSVFFIDN